MGHAWYRYLSAKDTNMKVTEEVFHYEKCHTCGEVQLANVPRDLGVYYPQDYHCYRRPKSVEDLVALNHRADLIEPFIQGPGRRYLEVGPSFGAMTLAFKRRGWETHCIEMDQACCDFLRNELGATVYHSSDIPHTTSNLNGFDLVTSWHNLEHLTNPWESLSAMARLVNPGGLLAVAAPNPESLQFKFLKHKWTNLDAPRHVRFLPIGRIIEKLHDDGLEEIY